MFFIIDSRETMPKNIPNIIIHNRISKKEMIKTLIPASGINPNGIKGTIPPKNGEKPFTIDTIILVKVSAFS